MVAQSPFDEHSSPLMNHEISNLELRMLRIVSSLSIVLAVVGCEPGPPQPPVLKPVEFNITNSSANDVAVSVTARIIETELLESTPEGPAVSEVREEQVADGYRLDSLAATLFSTTNLQLSAQNNGALMEFEFAVLSFGAEAVSFNQVDFNIDGANLLSFDYNFDEVTGQFGFTTGYVARPRCGDGIINGAESCDDGGTTNLDGCSSSCAVE
jgi:cysteine-rich repeat protein